MESKVQTIETGQRIMTSNINNLEETIEKVDEDIGKTMNTVNSMEMQVKEGRKAIELVKSGMKDVNQDITDLSSKTAALSATVTKSQETLEIKQEQNNSSSSQG